MKSKWEVPLWRTRRNWSDIRGRCHRKLLFLSSKKKTLFIYSKSMHLKSTDIVCGTLFTRNIPIFLRTLSSYVRGRLANSSFLRFLLLWPFSPSRGRNRLNGLQRTYTFRRLYGILRRIAKTFYQVDYCLTMIVVFGTLLVHYMP